MVSVIESACEGHLISGGKVFFSQTKSGLAHLALMEMIALPHLNAVKDVVASVDHFLTIFVQKCSAWIHL